MIRISKLADYAVVILAALADVKQMRSAAALAEVTGVPEPTVSKILKLLARGGLVISARGINGGYLLSRSAENISVEDIIRVIDGPISITACSDGHEPDCSLGSVCAVRGRWDDVNTAIRDALSGVALTDMAKKKDIEVRRYGSH